MPFPEIILCAEQQLSSGGIPPWVRSQRAKWESQLEESGALLFRGLPLLGAEGFDAFVAAFGLSNYSYSESFSNAVRVELTSRVFTANEAPSSAVIALHHELAQTPHFPTYLFFYCDRPADRGGETVVCDSVAMFEKLREERPEFARACEERGLTYRTWMPPDNDPNSGQGRSWRSTFGADSTEQAETEMDRFGYGWKWLPDGSLLATSPILPAVEPTGTGAKAFFNQLIAAWAGWRSNAAEAERPVSFGDGSPLADADVRAAIEIAESVSIDVGWQAGDVACLDNRAVMHGRRPFEGERRLWASFAVAGLPAGELR